MNNLTTLANQDRIHRPLSGLYMVFMSTMTSHGARAWHAPPRPNLAWLRRDVAISTTSAPSFRARTGVKKAAVFLRGVKEEVATVR